MKFSTPDVKCCVLEGASWKIQLSQISHSLVFIDEGNTFLNSKEFAEKIRGTDNYYVLFTRSSLSTLPYSVNAVYEIKKSGKYGHLKRTYNNFHRLYALPEKTVYPNELNCILDEDSHSGHQFWECIADQNGLKCKSAEGKSNIYACLQEIKNHVLVVADGSAFGPEMEKVYFYMKEHPGSVFIYLPESFEWMLLKAEFTEDQEVQRILQEPYDYADSIKYFSWEQLFEEVLVSKTKDSYKKYRKDKLNKYYLEDRQIKKIEKVLNEDDIHL